MARKMNRDSNMYRDNPAEDAELKNPGMLGKAARAIKSRQQQIDDAVNGATDSRVNEITSDGPTPDRLKPVY